MYKLNDECISLAAKGEIIDKLGHDFLAGSISYKLPAEIKNTGLKITGINKKNIPGSFTMLEVHGHMVVPRFDHVWIKHSDTEKSIYGRFNFFLATDEDQNYLITNFSVIFDHLGNIRIGKSMSFDMSMFEQDAVKSETMNAILVGVIAAVQEKLETVQK